VAETNHYRSQYELLRAEANLIHAMGRDLVEVYKELNGRVSEHRQ